MKENIKVTKAKIGLILDHPFFATLILKKKFIEDTSIKTASTDGKEIRYNPKFFDGLTHDEAMAVIAHEALHITSLHHTRRDARSQDKWNTACDYAINPILKEAGFSLPKGALLHPAYEGKSAEEIYRLIPDGNNDDGGDDNQSGGGGNNNQQQNQQPQQGNGKGKGQGNSQPQPNPGMGDVTDAPATTQAEMQQQEAEAKQELAQALQVGKQAGKLPASLERLIEEMLEPKVHWKEVLSRFLGEIAKNDYCFTRPNTRYMGKGFILPSLYNIEMGDIVLLVDTSGSIDRELLNRFAGEMQDICSLTKTTIKVVYVDAAVQAIQEIEPDDVVDLKPKGGGGTSFVPGFDWMAENGIEPKACVYFTDGYCSDFPEEQPFPILWAVTGNSHFDPPLGESVNID